MTFLADPRVAAYRQAYDGDGERPRLPADELAIVEAGFAEYLLTGVPTHMRMVVLRVLAREGISRDALRQAGGLTDAQAAELPMADRGERDPVSALRALPYAEYLKTDHWYFTRRLALERAGHRCQVCNAKSRLEVHHRTYENRGEEPPEDLIVLCDPCHELFHEHRDLAA